MSQTFHVKFFFLLFLPFISTIALSQQNIYDSVFVDGRWRTYMTHLPASYSPSGSYPLLFCFHGGQSTPQSTQLGWQVIAYMTELSQKADDEGFIVVYPEGTVFNNTRTWNAGSCCPPAMNAGIDDVGFVNTLIDTLLQEYAVDADRVYASGSSNGAMLCFRLACTLSHRIAAFAAISATQVFFPCNPSSPSPIIQFHSRLDSAVLYSGGIGNGPSGVDFISQDSTLNIWKNLNNCLNRDTVVDGGATGYSLVKLQPCDCGVEYHHYSTTDGGHSWPGGNPNNNPVSAQLNATDLLWSFFENYTLGCSTTSLDEDIEQPFTIYPNPTSDHLTISPKHAAIDFSLVSLSGKIQLAGKTTSEINISSLSPGVYFFTLQIDDMISRYKVIKK